MPCLLDIFQKVPPCYEYVQVATWNNECGLHLTSAQSGPLLKSSANYTEFAWQVCTMVDPKQEQGPDQG